MFKKFKNLIKQKDLSKIGIANILGNTIAAVFWFVLASISGTEDYGQISYLVALSSIGATIALVGGTNPIIVFAAKQIKVKTTIFLISISSSIITAIIFIIIFQNTAVSLFIIGFIIFNLTISEILGRKIFGQYLKYFVVQKIIMFALGIPFYYIFGVEGVILAYALSFFILIKNAIILFKTEKINFKLFKPKLRFVLNNYGKEMTYVFSKHVDKLIIAPIFGFSILGNYYLGIQVLMVLTMIPSIVFQYTLSNDSQGESKREIKKLAIILSIIFAILGVLITPFVIPVLFPEYLEAVNLIQIMCIVIIPRTVSMMCSSKLLGEEKSSPIILSSILFLSIQIPGIFILGDLIGINGIAVSLLLGEILQASFLSLSIKRTIKHNYKK